MNVFDGYIFSFLQKLEFIVSSSESKSREPKTLSMEKISVKLDELIGKNSSNEEVFYWIEVSIN